MKKIPLREFSINITKSSNKKNNTNNNDALTEKILEQLSKKFYFIKNKLHFRKKNDSIELCFGNVPLLNFSISGNQKTGFYIIIDESKSNR